MSRGGDLLDRLEDGEALRCRNCEQEISWVFVIEDGDVIRIHETDERFETTQVSRDMAALSIQAVAVTTEIVPIEEVEEL